MKTCLKQYHQSTFDDGKSPARKINVELTYGFLSPINPCREESALTLGICRAGGGGTSARRKAKIKEKNKKLQAEREREAKKRQEEKQQQKRKQQNQGGEDRKKKRKEQKAEGGQDQGQYGDMHPSRLERMQ